MIKRVIPAALVAAMLASSAIAAAQSMSGVIKSVDTAKNDIVLQSGETVSLPAKFDMKKLKVGEKVKITYQKQGNTMVASKIEAMK